MSSGGGYKFTKTAQGYEVSHGGETIGTISKYERRYNLQRPFTVRGWTATPEGALSPLGIGRAVAYRTRLEAADALMEHRTRGGA